MDLYSDEVVAVKSIIFEEEYEAHLKRNTVGCIHHRILMGFNRMEPFPFWSSEPFTYASVVLTLTQYKELVASGQIF